MNETNKKSILIIAALIILGVAVYFFYWMRTPQYAFTQIHEAITQHDLKKFEKHVDMNTLYSSAYEDLISFSIGNPKEINPFMLSLIQGFKPTVISAITDETRHYVETGSWSDNSTANNAEQSHQEIKNSQEEGQKITNILQEQLNLKPLRYDGVISYEQLGKTATVEIKIYDTRVEHTFIVKATMVELDDNSWRLSEINNLNEVLIERKKIISEKLKELNSSLRKKINEQIKTQPQTLYLSSTDGLFPSYTLKTKFELRNISNTETITQISGSVDLLDQNGLLLHSSNFDHLFPIKPQQAIMISPFFALNQFNSETIRLIRRDQNNLNWQVNISEITLANGENIKLLNKLP